MLVSFTVKNFRSFKYEQTFDMGASSIREHKDSVFTVASHRLLPVAIVYGANSGGKSNLILAIAQMQAMIRQSVKLNKTDRLPYDPFALDKTSSSQPTFFEIQFTSERATYRYGFEYNEREIVSEWLYERKFKEREYELFVRSHDDIDVSLSRFAEGEGKEELTNSNRLFLSLVAQLKGVKSNMVMECFETCSVLSGIDTETYEAYTIRMFMEHLEGADEALDFFTKVGLGFTQLSIKEVDFPKEAYDTLPESLKVAIDKDPSGKFVEMMTTHQIYDDYGKVVGEQTFNKNKMESEGTKTLIELSGPIFYTLSKGRTLVVDELDAKLHPLLTRNIVLLFMNPEINRYGAQLIFATHDTNLLDLDIIRRDQIWFAEKDSVDSTALYSLVEFKDEEGKKIRNDRDIKRDYIRGRYGAVPFVRDLN